MIGNGSLSENTTSSERDSATGTGTDTVTAAIIVIGDEILSGRTEERNINFIAKQLTAMGIRLREVRVVGDDEEEIGTALNALRAQHSYVFTTGGIGPTHDDITAQSVARAFGVGIDVDERALSLMQPFYEARGLELTPSRLRMARIPDGARLIHNPISIAPGFMIENVVVMAGVPEIMQVMLDDAAQYLKCGAPMLSDSIVVHRPEGELADLFSEHQNEFPDIGMGSYPAFRDGRLFCELVLRSIDAQHLSKAMNSLRDKLAAHGFL